MFFSRFWNAGIHGSSYKVKYSQPFLDREKERETHIGVDGDGRQYLTGSMTYIKYAWPALFLSAAAATQDPPVAYIHKANIIYRARLLYNQISDFLWII